MSSCKVRIYHNFTEYLPLKILGSCIFHAIIKNRLTLFIYWDFHGEKWGSSNWIFAMIKIWLILDLKQDFTARIKDFYELIFPYVRYTFFTDCPINQFLPSIFRGLCVDESLFSVFHFMKSYYICNEKRVEQCGSCRCFIQLPTICRQP